MSHRDLRKRNPNISYVPPSIDEKPGPSSTPSTSRSQKAAITKNHSAAKTPLKPPPKSPSLRAQLPNPPFFSPISHTHPLHSAYNTLPRSMEGLDSLEPIHVFSLFFNEALFDTMTTNTNLYAENKRDNEGAEGRKWSAISVQDLKCWTGILIYMGICKLPSVGDYWCHDGLWPTHHWSTYMSQTRFEQIRRYFHISPPNALAHSAIGRRLWHHKVDPILDQLRHASQSYRMPSSNVSCDEAMIRCTGRSADTYKMKNKPIPKGVKFHVAADHGYVFNFHPTSNKSGPDPFDEPSDFSNTSSVVLQLVKKLPYSQKAFNVYMDNYYTNLPLFAELRKLGIGACGTARTTSKDFPQAVKVTNTANLDFHYKAGVVERGVAVLLWIDNGPVSMMTTIHRLKGRNSEILKMRKKPGPKSTNAAAIKKAAIFTEDEWEKEMLVPTCINDYNHHMGGVDVADQYRSYYDTQLTSFRTWYPIFFWALDTALTNSFIIWRDLRPLQPWGHKEFRMLVAWELILSSAPRSAEKRGLDQVDTPDIGPSTSTKTFYLTKNRDLPRASGTGRHIPLRHET